MLLAIDDGLFSGYADFADICFLIATILFAILFVVHLRVGKSLDGMIIAAGLTALSLGWLVL